MGRKKSLNLGTILDKVTGLFIQNLNKSEKLQLLVLGYAVSLFLFEPREDPDDCLRPFNQNFSNRDKVIPIFVLLSFSLGMVTCSGLSKHIYSWGVVPTVKRETKKNSTILLVGKCQDVSATMLDNMILSVSKFSGISRIRNNSLCWIVTI